MSSPQAGWWAQVGQPGTLSLQTLGYDSSDLILFAAALACAVYCGVYAVRHALQDAERSDNDATKQR